MGNGPTVLIETTVSPVETVYETVTVYVYVTVSVKF